MVTCWGEGWEKAWRRGNQWRSRSGESGCRVRGQNTTWPAVWNASKSSRRIVGRKKLDKIICIWAFLIGETQTLELARFRHTLMGVWKLLSCSEITVMALEKASLFILLVRLWVGIIYDLAQKFTSFSE
jgi:hypothetical protein